MLPLGAGQGNALIPNIAPTTAKTIKDSQGWVHNFFMGEDEKAQQIGMAVSELNAAKVERAHLEQKCKRVLAAYREAAKTDSRVRIAGGKVIFEGWSTAKPSDLMNESELASFFLELHEARLRVEKAAQVTQSLGITALQ